MRRPFAFVLLAAAAASLSTPAEGASGFFVSASKAKPLQRGAAIALMREGNQTTLSIQTNYEGPLEDFALVVPVPVAIRKEDVRTLPTEVFDRLDQVTAPRVVEYWEQDPCQGTAPTATASPSPAASAPPYSMTNGPFRRGPHQRVLAEAQFAIDEYDIAVLSATDSASLETWLKREKYLAPEGSAAILEPWVKSGGRFVVAKVNAKKLKPEKRSNGDTIAKLPPLRVTYETPSLTVPLRLGLLNAKGPLDVVVYTLGRKQRYEAANLPNIAVPTNLEVGEKARGEFEGFYTSLFDKVVEKTPKAAVLEYSWDASSCEACTAPPLSFSELGSLGGDVLPFKGDEIPVPSFRGVPRDAGAASAPSASAAVAATATPSAVATGHRGSMLHTATKELTITRMHLRYTKETMSEDLVLRAAPAITGGREVRGSSGELETTNTGGTVNAFLSRYTVRHPFSGPVACNAPHRGVWGSRSNDSPVLSFAAKDLVFAAHTGTMLAPFLRGAVKDLGLTGTAEAPVGAVPTRVPESTTNGPSITAPTTTANVAPTATSTPKSSCGCHAVGEGGSSSSKFAGATLGTLALATVLSRRRRKRQASAKRSDSGTTP